MTDDIDTLSPAKQVRFSYSDSPSPSQLVRERRLQDHQHDVEWLVNVLKGQPGFKDFIEKRNRRLNNPDVVLHWAFATRVTEDYHLKMSGAPGSSTVSISSLNYTHHIIAHKRSRANS